MADALRDARRRRGWQNGSGRTICPTTLRPAYLSQILDRPLPAKDGGTLHIIGEACDYMTNMGKKRELHHPTVAELQERYVIKLG